MKSYLVVANQTLDSGGLLELLRERTAAGPAEFWLAVPATPVKDLASNVVAVPMPVMGGVLTLPEPPAEARKLAEAKLAAALRKLSAAGITASGAVADGDPLRAVEEAVAGRGTDRGFDEIIVSTLPPRFSRWLHHDLPGRLQQKYDLPVTQIVAHDL
jgi:hypothetical protein